MKFIIKCQTKSGSSFLLPAHGKSGARATISNDSPSASEKIVSKPRSMRAKRKRGLGKMNFCPPVVPQSGTEGGKRFRNSALAEYQNRKIFVSLIEKNFEGARLKDVKKIFLFCSPKRSEDEAIPSQNSEIVNWRRVRDSNPRTAFRRSRFSKPSLSPLSQPSLFLLLLL